MRLAPGSLVAVACETPGEFWPAAREVIRTASMPWLMGHLRGFNDPAAAEDEARAYRRAAEAIRGLVVLRAPLDPRGGIDGHIVYLDYLDEVIEVAD